FAATRHMKGVVAAAAVGLLAVALPVVCQIVAVVVTATGPEDQQDTEVAVRRAMVAGQAADALRYGNSRIAGREVDSHRVAVARHQVAGVTEPASVRRRFEVIGPWIQIGDAIVLDVDRVVPGASALRWIERLRRLQNDEVGTDRGGQQRRAADHAEGARVRRKMQGWGHYIAGRGAGRARAVEA